ncbi:GL21748 [Drosophila persimilis]|uniref:GL21748 n=1 Tax=Drosophila persimilis TaxID=7234 RepID=B4GES2_DROPE|nr:GL21748 [Drosophila persimilis]
MTTRKSCHVLALLGLCLVCHEAAVVSGHVLVYRRISNQASILYACLIEEFNDLPAQFGPLLPPNGLKVYVVPAMPHSYGCDTLSRPPHLALSIGGQISGIHIPSVFVGHTTGKALATYFTPEVVLIINDELPFNINTQLILPFSILIGLCFLIMVIYMIYKCIREQRRLRRHRLPKSMLKKLPVRRYTKNNTNNKYDTCVICLDEFVEDDKLRVLPCSHPYHTHCIDPWLTENRRVCPICKRKVFTKGETRASRNRQPSLDSVTDTDDDTTPLLQQQPNGGRQGGQGSTSSAASAAAAGSSSSVATAAAAAAAGGTTRHGTFRRADAGRNPFEAQETQSSDDENDQGY